MTNPSAFRWDSRSLVWAAAVLAVSAGYALLIAKPRIARARELNRELQSERAELNARVQWLEVIARAEKEAAVLATRTANFEERIPAGPQLGGFLEELARLAKKHDLQSDTIQPGEAVRLAEVNALPIIIKVRGSFAGLHALFQDMERMPRLTRVEQLKAVSDPEHPGMVAAELNVKVFYRTTENEAKTG